MRIQTINLKKKKIEEITIPSFDDTDSFFFFFFPFLREKKELWSCFFLVYFGFFLPLSNSSNLFTIQHSIHLNRILIVRAMDFNI